MPIYAYKCDSCGFAKDVLQKVSDPLLSECPSCGKSTFAKQLTAAGFQLKGSGWYATDFKGGAQVVLQWRRLLLQRLMRLHLLLTLQRRPLNRPRRLPRRAVAVQLVPATADG